LRKAIVLYELAYRAGLKEQRLGVFDEDERLVIEIVGLQNDPEGVSLQLLLNGPRELLMSEPLTSDERACLKPV